jgi:SHAQKYF class myb-like DNA-binding protein
VNSNSELVQKKNAGRGRWSKSEHDRFMKGLEKFGKDWISVQKFVKTRSLTQVRSHAQKVFLHMEEVDIDALFEREDENYHKNGRRPFSKHW